MKPEELEAIGEAIFHFVERHLAFFICWLVWGCVMFFVAGPITDLAMESMFPGDSWILPTLGVCFLPGVLAYPNMLVVHLRTRRERQQRRLERLYAETARLERELGI